MTLISRIEKEFSPVKGKIVVWNNIQIVIQTMTVASLIVIFSTQQYNNNFLP
jgi:hypothetical protein